jgi:nucleoside-diphosphate-sugar epimerase
LGTRCNVAHRHGGGVNGGAILITGATGFVGSKLAMEFRRRSRPVRALVRTAANARHLSQAGIELIQGDIRNRNDVLRAAKGAKHIYHLAAAWRTAGHRDRYYYDVNVGGTENVLAAAIEHGVERVVHCSTSGVHGAVREIPCIETSPFNPGDIYQTTKLQGETLAQSAFANGMPGCVVRPAGIYGPADLRFLKLFRGILTGRFWMFGSGETLWHPVYIDDLIEGLILCGEHSSAIGETYILASNNYVMLNELVEQVAGALSCAPPRRRLPYQPLLASAVICEVLCKPLRVNPPLYRRRVEFFVKVRAFSIEKAKRELGYQPRIDLAEGLRRTAAWYRANGHLPGPEATTSARRWWLGSQLNRRPYMK